MRLGLSATPHRYNDPIGTKRIFNYFDKIINPLFTLEDAIRTRRLVPYKYHLYETTLTENEIQDWMKLSNQIKKEYARLSAQQRESDLPDNLKLLLIRRAKIRKKAHNKIGITAEIISKVYERGQRWLIYCDDQDQLNKVLTRLREIGFDPLEYHSSMASGQKESLDWFVRLGGVLVAIKCLDEGIDIPSITHALILASSQNPREFIQRRGRVLRVNPNDPSKTIAFIHDLIVLPPPGDDDDLLSIVKTELKRWFNSY